VKCLKVWSAPLSRCFKLLRCQGAMSSNISPNVAVALVCDGISCLCCQAGCLACRRWLACCGLELINSCHCHSKGMPASCSHWRIRCEMSQGGSWQPVYTTSTILGTVLAFSCCITSSTRAACTCLLSTRAALTSGPLCWCEHWHTGTAAIRHYTCVRCWGLLVAGTDAVVVAGT